MTAQKEKDHEKRKMLLEICREAREKGEKVNRRAVSIHVGLAKTTVLMLVKRLGFEDVLQNRKDFSKKRQKTFEDVQKIITWGKVVGRDDKGYFLIETEDGQVFKKSIEHLNNKDPRLTVHKHTEQSIISALKDMNFQYIEGFVDISTPMKTKCPNGHLRESSWVNIRDGGCPMCSKGGVSIKEMTIAYFVERLGVKQQKYRFSPKPGATNGKSIDIFCEKKRIGIEFCGLFWHYEKDTLGKTKHLEKLEMCKHEKIELFTLFENEFDFKKNQVFSYIASLFGLFSREINLSSCVQKNTSDENVLSFLDKNSFCFDRKFDSSYCFYYNGELVFVATKNNQSINNICCSLKTNILNKKELMNFLPSDTVFEFNDRFIYSSFVKEFGLVFVEKKSPKFIYYKLGRLGEFDFLEAERILTQNNTKKIDEMFDLSDTVFRRVWDCGYSVYRRADNV